MREQDQLDAALLPTHADDQAALEQACSILQVQDDNASAGAACASATATFAHAALLCKEERFGSLHQWYPFSYAAAFHARRAAWCLQQPSYQLLERQLGKQHAEELIHRHMSAACRYCLSDTGAGVLQKYRFTPQDEQLYRDVEGLIELLCNTLSALTKQQKQQGHSLPEQPAYLAALLQLFDAACWFLKGRSKPANWVSCLFKVAKLFSTESRTSAAASCQVTSAAMLGLSHMWGALKVAPMKAIFDTADMVQEQAAPRQLKRPRHLLDGAADADS